MSDRDHFKRFGQNFISREPKPPKCRFKIGQRLGVEGTRYEVVGNAAMAIAEF